MLTGFCISAEYAATRPSSSAIFLSIFSSRAIPWVWLISVPFNLFVVSIYNRWLPRIGPLKMMRCAVICVGAVHVFCALALHKFPQFIFFQFILKDIYIVLMFKQLWSMIHSTVASHRAKYLYGTIFGMGTVGATLGSLLPSFLAVNVGSESLFFCTVPIYVVLYFAYSNAVKRSPLNSASFSQDLTFTPTVREGFNLIRRSSLLIAILLMVVFMQVSIGLMDYQFNAHLETNILDKDLRTEYVGRLIGLTNALGSILQFVGGFLMIHFFGVRGSHLLIPFLLLANASVALAYPSFAIVSFVYLFMKSVDFSLFGVVREMLYIQLKMDEKFRAKAVIDVFAYRSSKALVSIFVLGLQFFIGTEILHMTAILSLFVFCAWIAAIFFLLKEKPSPVSL